MGLQEQLFWSLATQTLLAPPTEPEQVMPAGIWMATGKSMVGGSGETANADTWNVGGNGSC